MSVFILQERICFSLRNSPTSIFWSHKNNINYQVDNKFLKSGKNAEIWSVVSDFKNEDIFAHVTLKKTERSRLAELASKLLEL